MPMKQAHPLLTASLLLSVMVTLAACNKAGSTTSTSSARAVEAATVRAGTVSERLRIVGVLAPKDEVRLSFKTGGVIEAITVEEGSVVRRGQVLASLRSTEVDAQVRQAREAAEKAQRDLIRGRALLADEVATREQVEDLSTLAESARAGLSAAIFNARYARIEAPGDGVVLRKLAQANELIQAGQPVLSVSSLDRGWIVRGSFADRDVVRVRRGDSAEVTLDAFPGRKFAGRVQEVGSSADPQTGTFNVEFRIDPAGAAFASGMVAKLAMNRAPVGASSLPVVPLTALIAANGDEAYVFTLNGDIAQRRTVRLGAMDALHATVLDGIAVGERLVTEGAAYLNDGDHIRVVDAAARTKLTAPSTGKP